MQELLPIILGVLFGLLATSGSLPGPKAGWFIAGCVLAGATATFVNGETTTTLVGLFLSFDALLAWCGAVSVVIARRAYRTYILRR